MRLIACPTCGSALNAPEGLVGKTVQCPKCAARLRVPDGAGVPVTPVGPAPSGHARWSDSPHASPREDAVCDVAAAPRQQRYRECPFCGEDVLEQAKKCKHCGEVLDLPLRAAQEVKRSARGRGVDSLDEISPVARTTYILLGIFLGGFGIHNFVAGRTACAVGQLALSVVSLPLLFLCGLGLFTIWVPGVWAIIEVCTVEHDGAGRGRM